MIDILLATYNGEEYITEQLDSIMNQTYQDFQVLIRDDGSTDRTVEMIEAFIADRDESDRVNLMVGETPSGSAKRNFMKLTTFAESEYIMYSDQDDIWEPEKIEKTLTMMEKAEKKLGAKTPLLVHTDAYVADEDGQILADSLIEYMNLPRVDSLKNLLLQNSVTGCTMMLNRAAAQMLIQCNPDEMLMHDHFAAVLVATFGRVLKVEEPLMRYRQHGDNEVGAANARSLRYKLNRYRQGKEKIQGDLEDGMRQAKYILEKFDDRLSEAPDHHVRLLKAYAGLLEKSHKERQDFYKSHHMYKNGRLKRMAQLWWC